MILNTIWLALKSLKLLFIGAVWYYLDCLRTKQPTKKIWVKSSSKIEKNLISRFINIINIILMEPRKFKKAIDNPEGSPWFDWIRDGKKTYEGRLYYKDWKQVRLGDTIVFYYGANKVETIVTDLRRHTNFVLAYWEFGDKLVPRLNVKLNVKLNVSASDVADFYYKYFTAKDIRKYGTVIVGIRVKN